MCVFSDIRRDSSFTLAAETTLDLHFIFCNITEVCITFRWQFKGMQTRRKDTPWVLSTWFSCLLSVSLSLCLLLSILSFINIQCAVRSWIIVMQSLLASGIAGKKYKEQMVVFVIPSSFQCPGKPHHLSLSLTLCLSLPTTAALQASE